MLGKGVEPLLLSELDPKSSASANSATRASQRDSQYRAAFPPAINALIARSPPWRPSGRVSSRPSPTIRRIPMNVRPVPGSSPSRIPPPDPRRICAALFPADVSQPEVIRVYLNASLNSSSCPFGRRGDLSRLRLRSAPLGCGKVFLSSSTRLRSALALATRHKFSFGLSPRASALVTAILPLMTHKPLPAPCSPLHALCCEETLSPPCRPTFRLRFGAGAGGAHG